jgi:hypothetical protein
MEGLAEPVSKRKTFKMSIPRRWKYLNYSVTKRNIAFR